MSTLLTNIKEIVGPIGQGSNVFSKVENGFILIENGIIKDFGDMSSAPNRADKVEDLSNKTVLPCWCDSHTHLVYAASREQEFVDRINGLSYEEIAQKGGGILNSAKRLNETDEYLLYEKAWERLEEVIRFGTGAIEIKSGYGLTLEGELKMLRVIRKLKEAAPIPIKATFLGAHTIPLPFRNNRQGYIDLVIDKMLPQIADEGLADYIDVFCEKVAFTAEEAGQIIEAGAKYGLKAKIHTNQFNSMGGIEMAINNKALSVDHLEVLTEDEINLLAQTNTIATLLPSAPFFLNDPLPAARKLLDKKIKVALATDFNPGSSPSGKMPFIIALACIKMGMTPEEAIISSTIHGAEAMELESSIGHIAKGKAANLIITKSIPSYTYIPYAFGSDVIDKVLINGK